MGIFTRGPAFRTIVQKHYGGGATRNGKILATMEPMFLRDVEASEEKSAFNDLIAIARNAGAEYPQIWHMFAFQPHATRHLERFTQAIMREPAPLTPGLRELIATYTSARNHCPF